MTDLEIRPYQSEDEASWLRCRALAFLSTSYFDDVVATKPTYDVPAIELVAVDGIGVLGVFDVALYEAVATIETVAVDPDRRRAGVAAALLAEAVRLLPVDVPMLDAWTREDPQANAWYQKQGFSEVFRYLHVYAGGGEEIDRAVLSTRPGLRAVSSFFHADIVGEEELRREFARVHVCRRYVRDLASRDTDG